MTENKKTIATKLKAHFAENKETYIRFGCYTVGVVATTVAYSLMDKHYSKLRTARWDAAIEEGLTVHGEGTRTTMDRAGHFFHYVPEVTIETIE